jgi:hypothetical protein
MFPKTVFAGSAYFETVFADLASKALDYLAGK